jgi:hypothetical protein
MRGVIKTWQRWLALSRCRAVPRAGRSSAVREVDTPTALVPLSAALHMYLHPGVGVSPRLTNPPGGGPQGNGACAGGRRRPIAAQLAADTLFDRLIALNQAAQAAWCAPTAYYALVAAMLEAGAAQDISGLVLVQTLAEEQAEGMARTGHGLSPSPASGYGSLLTTLAQRIQYQVSRLHKLRLRPALPLGCPSSGRRPRHSVCDKTMRTQ